MQKISYSKSFPFLHLSLLPPPNNSGLIHLNYEEWMIFISVSFLLLVVVIRNDYCKNQFLFDLDN
jgi:hypothetical protein